jgi:hypothetical protein
MGDIYETARQGIAPPTQAPTQAPTAPQGKAPDAKRAHMILMALLPLAAKQGGQTAVTGLLHGYQQAMARQQGLARQGMLDDRQLEQQQFTRSIQQGQLDRQYAAEDRMTARDDQAEADRKLGLQQQFLSKVAESMGREDLTPEEASAQLAAFQQMAPRYGLQDGAVQSLAPPTSRLERNKLRKILTQVDTAYKDRMAPEDVDKLVPDGGDGQTVGQIRARVSGLGAQPTGRPKSTANVGSFEDYVVRRFGAQPTADQITQARKDYNQSDDRPRININTGGGGLPPRTQTAVNSIARGWDSLPIVKTVQKQAEASDFAARLDPNTKNPADDQALIYAFAKAMDPDSVVREGEYATVQKYAQSWAESLGFNIARIFSNTTFLTPQARANMKATIRERYQTGLGQYQNVRKSYAGKINKLTGLADGEEYLTDYGGGFPAGPASPPPGGVTTGAPTVRAGSAYERYTSQGGR